MDKYLKRPQNADNTMFFLTLQCAAKNNHNDERSKRAWVHWCRLQPLKPQNVIFRRDHTGIHCCWSFSGWHHWCVHFHLMITKGLVFLSFFSFFPRAQTQHQIAKELRENDVRVVQRVMRYQNTLDGQHQSHLCTCATRREDSSNARENQKLLSTHTRTHAHTHTHTRTVKCSSTLSLSARLNQRIQKWNRGGVKRKLGKKRR